MTQTNDPIDYVEKKHDNPKNKAKGIPFEEARRSIDRIAKEDWRGCKDQQLNLMNSIRNQAELHETGSGDTLVDEIVRDVPVGKNIHDSYKSRPGGWLVNKCFKECLHKNTQVCNLCFRFSKLEPKEISDVRTS